jgi:hypothetical protein
MLPAPKHKGISLDTSGVLNKARVTVEESVTNTDPLQKKCYNLVNRLLDEPAYAVYSLSSIVPFSGLVNELLGTNGSAIGSG